MVDVAKGKVDAQGVLDDIPMGTCGDVVVVVGCFLQSDVELGLAHVRVKRGTSR